MAGNVQQGDFARTDWILKEVDLTVGTECQIAAESLKAEYIRYQQLNGVPGVAICAPLVSDGERPGVTHTPTGGASV